ncbi:type II toxin-antitoxin system RelE/ParE family toxin [Crocosphaera sp. Alani8]|uniref:type II toxin-antitoxin system RelE/ParE family toxin n=1 Tax=Crocosphaera sp. Alani8 TaxID=3038952 RepID=UPI00313DB559
MSDKPINWVGSSREDLKSFPATAKTKAGFQLRAVQKGQLPSDFKPMPTIGKGVEEIRIRAKGAYRVFYVARFEEAVYVLHAFEKKTQKTAKEDLELGRQRYQQMIRFRQELQQKNDE